MLKIDPAVWAAFPQTKMGALVIEGVPTGVKLAPDEAEAGFRTIEQKYGSQSRKALKQMPPIDAYTAYYKKFGYSYPVLGQLESVLAGKKTLHPQSGLLQAMFLCEIESMVITAGHDLARLLGPLQVQVARGDETYRSISQREVTAVPGDLLVRDDNGVISSMMRGPDEGSRITAQTAGVFFVLYAPPVIATQTVTAALTLLEKRVRSFAPGCTTRLLQVYEQE